MTEPQTDNATQQAEPTPAERRDPFDEALNRVRMDWPDVELFEDRMWQIARLFNDRDAVTVKTYEMWMLSLYLLAKLMYGAQGADVDAVLTKPAQTVQ